MLFFLVLFPFTCIKCMVGLAFTVAFMFICEKTYSMQKVFSKISGKNQITNFSKCWIQFQESFFELQKLIQL